MRPEVLQQKHARIRLLFVGSNLPVYNNLANYSQGQYQFISDWVLVMSVTK